MSAPRYVRCREKELRKLKGEPKILHRWAELSLQTMQGYFSVADGGVYDPSVDFKPPPFRFLMNFSVADLPPRGICNDSKRMSPVVAALQTIAACPPLAGICHSKTKEELAKEVSEGLYTFLDIVGKVRLDGGTRGARKGALENMVRRLPKEWLEAGDQWRRDANFLEVLCRNAETDRSELSSLMGALFGSYVHDEIICDTCAADLHRPEIYQTILPLTVPPSDIPATLEQQFGSLFGTVRKTNMRCGGDCSGFLLLKKTVVVPPNVLTIHLSLPEVQDPSNGGQKGSVTLPKTFDLTPYIRDKTTFASPVRNFYRLCSFVLRTKPTQRDSHHIAVCRNGEKWYLCDDEDVQEISEPKLQSLLSHPGISLATFCRDRKVQLTPHPCSDSRNIRQILPPSFSPSSMEPADVHIDIDVTSQADSFKTCFSGVYSSTHEGCSGRSTVSSVSQPFNFPIRTLATKKQRNPFSFQKIFSIFGKNQK